MQDLKRLAEELIAAGHYRNQKDEEKDRDVLDAIEPQGQGPRNTVLVGWLNHYRVLMSFTGIERIRVADEILGFAADRRDESPGLDKHAILSEFKNLEKRLAKVAPRTKAGAERDVTSLTSKGLWCCYPNDVPIHDRNAVAALGVISRIFRIATEQAPSEYERFLDVWFRVYREVEPVIDRPDLSACRQKVRVLDRMLWYLGATGFYNGP